MADLLQGRFVWHELMTTDTKAAEAFYGRVVGWSAEPFPGSKMGYAIWKAGEKRVGGLMALPADAKAAGAPPSWMIYVGVHDADAIAAKARSLGGKVAVPPTDIPTVGRFAVLADPQGAHIAILRPDGPSPTGPETDPVPLEVSWRELATTDLDGCDVVLHGALRLGDDQGQRHGAARHLPGVRPLRPAARRDVQEAGRDALPTELARLRERDGHPGLGRGREGAGRQDPSWPGGDPRRRPDPAVPGPAGCRVRAAPDET